MTMESQLFESMYLLSKMVDFPASHVSFPGGGGKYIPEN